VEHGHQERDADVVVALAQFADQLAPRRVLEDDGRGVEVFGDVLERELDVDRARAEQALGAGDLAIEEFVPDRGGVAVLRPEGPADTCQQDFWCAQDQDLILFACSAAVASQQLE
jgi:hypothetical protein